MIMISLLSSTAVILMVCIIVVPIRLVQAIQESKHGKPVTIKEAMQKGWLHPGAKLIPPSRAADNSDPNCYNDPSRYCYSNLAVLRQLRILPLGLEIAAKNSDPDHPWTLEEVINGFYDCNYNKDGSVNYDGENKPFCHLVDPNWVVQLSQTRCDAKDRLNSIERRCAGSY